MKIAIIHLSDFHVKDSDRFVEQKIDSVVSALTPLEKIDDHVVIFSGDLSFSGQINQFKKSRHILSRIIKGLKQKNDNKYVNMFMVPGNHDLCFPAGTRGRNDIQEHYDNGTIEELLPTEESYLENYYSYSITNGKKPHDILLNKQYREFDNYKIQFNLINTALFSTLEPNDKELHYFPDDKLQLLSRADDANLCITVMHHSYEWFNWNYKDNLEKAIIDNSEFLLTGHDHREKTTNVSIDNSLDTWISAAGEMKFSSIDFVDSFNVLVIDTEKNSFDGYSFSWDKKVKVYTRKNVAVSKNLQNHSAKLTPLPSFIKGIKEDSYNLSKDFTDYYVFPKLISKEQNEFKKNTIILTIEEFKSLLFEKKKLLISGASNSGKTSLLKYLYCSLIDDKMPFFLSADSKQRIIANNFIRHLFEEQYGEGRGLFEKYEQLDLDKKVLIIDGWDDFNIKNRKDIIKKIEESFGNIVFSVSNSNNDVVETIKDNLNENAQLFELHIKPFFAEKRSELVRSICSQNNTINDEDANSVNRLIDSLVQNNKGLFLLNPAFIVRYTNCVIKDPYHDYSKGEAIFSKVFESELNQSIINYAKSSNKDADEFFVVIEEIAGYMFANKKDQLQIEEVRSIINKYNEVYGEHVNLRDVITIGKMAKIFRETDDLLIYFINKNHLSYFIAKYLIRLSQGEPADKSGIEYVLKNICFGINSDIILFITYILNNTSILSFIKNYAGELLAPWDAISLSDKNIAILHNVPLIKIKAPSEDDKKQYEKIKEESEELSYSEDVIEAKGVFEYDDKDVDKYRYGLIRAIKYTEIICKALPSFYSRLKLDQKNELIDSIFLYPRKIAYAILEPLDKNVAEICQDIIDYINENDLMKKNGKEYSEEDILKLIYDAARAEMLYTFDHFAEFATSSKSYDLLINKKTDDISEQLERLLIIENYGDTDRLIKEAEPLLKIHEATEYEIMIKLIIRKHLLTNKSIPFQKRQRIVDKVFGENNRKYFLVNKE